MTDDRPSTDAEYLTRDDLAAACGGSRQAVEYILGLPVTPAATKILIYLWCKCGPNLRHRPGAISIAAAIGMNRPYVSETLQALKSDGYLTIERLKNGCKGWMFKRPENVTVPDAPTVGKTDTSLSPTVGISNTPDEPTVGISDTPANAEENRLESRKVHQAQKAQLSEKPTHELSEIPTQTIKTFKEEEEEEERNPQTPLKAKTDVLETFVQANPAFDTPEFRTAWSDWLTHRKQIRHALKPMTEARQLKDIGKSTPAVAIGRIEQSIRNGWQGLFELRETNGTFRQAASAGAGQPGTAKFGSATAGPERRFTRGERCVIGAEDAI